MTDADVDSIYSQVVDDYEDIFEGTKSLSNAIGDELFSQKDDDACLSYELCNEKKRKRGYSSKSDEEENESNQSKAIRLSGGKPKTYRKTDIKKDILGKERIIYKISGSKKEYIKYKGDYIYVKEYIKSRAASNKRSKPGSKKASKASSAALPSKDLSAPAPKPKAPLNKPTPTKSNASKEPSRKPSKKH